MLSIVAVTAVLISSIYSTVYGCPDNCECRKTWRMAVQCSNLPSLPSDIPRTTEYLSITNSTFTTLDSEYFERLRFYKLTELYVSDTPISHVNLKSDLDDLKVLLLSSTNIRTLNSADFIGAPDLIGLGITGSPLKDINITTGLNKLKFLTLHNNKIEALSSFNLPRLDRLDLQQNAITKVALTEGFENLSFLSLDNNKLTSFDSKDYAAATNLRHLSLKENQISTVDASKTMPNLSELSLNCNSIKKINTESIIQHLPKLSELQLKNCKGGKTRNKITCDCEMWKLSKIHKVSGFCRDKDAKKLKIKKLENGQIPCV